MKALFLYLFLFSSFEIFGQQAFHDYLYPIVTDLNNDQIPDSIILGSSLMESSLFNRITISITGFKKQSYVAKHEWTLIDTAFLSKNKNAVNSKDIFLYKAKDQSVILLFGNLDGAGLRGDFSIFNIQNNKVKLVFDKNVNDVDIEIPVTIKDIDLLGGADFVFTNNLELFNYVDSLKADIGPYNPYFVFTINDDCKLNEELTKKYNELHYIFAGFEYDEKIKVLYPRDGSKPRIID